MAEKRAKVEAVAWRWTQHGDRKRFCRLSAALLFPQGDVAEVEPLYPALALVMLQSEGDRKDEEIAKLKASLARAELELSRAGARHE
jgi:hypothetical protein